MEVQLFEYNQCAYGAVTTMLQETGRAAVIHPTGTGKSFIGLKLAQDHPTGRICWLGPSTYIYQTQLDNWRSAGGDTPDNVRFLTYARLMGLGAGEIEQLAPQFIVLDEFHRCGAEMWGKGVQNLLNQYPETPILGLSATNIRYLDNQRDMADELFHGNIASEMTLGEAIVRGILNPPTYIVSVYSYQRDLDRYRARIKQAKSKAARDEAEKYFTALRHALEKADGLDEIFKKHMEDKSGKYIAFCANVEHMNEMVGHVPEWFSQVDRHPNIYRAYSDAPETSQAFAAFKADKSEHLKLLFCIDMLNEGIHVDDVSGVILFRPTVSPIIYKQQIGRALCASKRKEPVIFDIVNNFENLYCIGAIEQEMQAAITYYRFLGAEREVVTERFQIIDEVRNCRELFESMNDALTASWELMYDCAKQYFKQTGNLEVPRRYRTREGYSLGSWLQTQRKVRAGEAFGKLDAGRIEKLDAIGMRWGSYRDASWEKNFSAAEQYFALYGNLNINASYTTPSGLALGRWLCQLRVYRKNNIQCSYLTQERVRKLDALGMIWDVPNYLWETNFMEAMAYFRAHGDLDVPVRYISPNGIKLGAWIRNLRAIRTCCTKGAKLSGEQIARLDSIGMLWDDKFTRMWNRGFEEARAYYEAHGNLNVPATYCAPSGFKLGGWVANQREAAGRISPERRKKLDSLGMIWRKPDAWEVRYALAKAYFEAHGNLNLPAQYKIDGIWLSKWLNEQKQIYCGNRPGKCLSRDQIERLEAISFDWKDGFDRAWDERYARAKQYYEEHGSLSVPGDYVDAGGKRLALWISVQRRYYRQGKLTHEQVQKLTDIGMVWDSGRECAAARGGSTQRAAIRDMRRAV